MKLTQEIIDQIQEAMLHTNLKGEINWKHPGFAERAARLEEQNKFLENPFEVAEGMFECKAFLWELDQVQTS